MVGVLPASTRQQSIFIFALQHLNLAMAEDGHQKLKCNRFTREHVAQELLLLNDSLARP